MAWHSHLVTLQVFELYKTNHKFLEKKPTLHYRNSHRISNKIETWNLTAEWHLLEVIERGLTNEIFTSVSATTLEYLESVSGKTLAVGFWHMEECGKNVLLQKNSGKISFLSVSISLFIIICIFWQFWESVLHSMRSILRTLISPQPHHLEVK